MRDQISELFTKKNIINLVVLLLLVLGIPLAVQLAKTQQIFRSNAAAVEPNLEFRGNCINSQGGTTVATCKDIKVKLTPPWPQRTSSLLKTNLLALWDNLHLVTSVNAQTSAPVCTYPGYPDGRCGTAGSPPSGYTCTGGNNGLGFAGCTSALPYCWGSCTANSSTPADPAPITGTPSVTSQSVSPTSINAGGTVTITASGSNVDHIDVADYPTTGSRAWIGTLRAPNWSMTWTPAQSLQAGTHLIIFTPFRDAANAVAGTETNVPITITGGGTGGGSCSDDCFSTDLRTNVGVNPSTGRCDSGSSSVSHFCTANGSEFACNNSLYVCNGGTWSPKNASVPATARTITINIQADTFRNYKSNEDVVIPFRVSGADYVNLKVDGSESWGTGCGAQGNEPCPRQISAAAGSIVWPANHASRNASGPKTYTITLKAYYTACEGSNCPAPVESQSKTIGIEADDAPTTTNCAENGGICADSSGVSADGKFQCSAGGWRQSFTGCDPQMYCYITSACTARSGPPPLGVPVCAARTPRSCVDADGRSGTQYCAAASGGSSCNPGSCYKTLTGLEAGCAVDASTPALASVWLGNKFLQSAIAANQQDYYFRTCDIDQTAGTVGSCTKWEKKSLANIRGVGGEKYLSFDTFAVVEGTNRLVYQSLLGNDGITSYARRCSASQVETDGIGCGSVGWQTVRLEGANSPASGHKFRSFDGFIGRDGDTFFVQQSLIEEDGKTSYNRRCRLDPLANGGVQWDSAEACPRTWGRLDLSAANVGPQAGGKFRSLDSFVLKAGSGYKLYQYVLADNGKDAWVRTCNMSSTAGSAGVDYSSCTAWGQPFDFKQTVLGDLKAMIESSLARIINLLNIKS